jgi:hypothetical protein
LQRRAGTAPRSLPESSTCRVPARDGVARGGWLSTRADVPPKSLSAANQPASVPNRTVLRPVVIASSTSEAALPKWGVPLFPTLASNWASALDWISIDRQEGGIEMRNYAKKPFWGKTLLAAMTLAGALTLIGAPVVRADEGACQRRVAKADHRLHQAVEHHGWNSRQAANARQQLHEAREYCWSHAHRWWDEHERRWHTDRDWDDHDHDHDRDRNRDHDHQ